MQPSKKFAYDVGITLLASVVSLPLGFVITILLARYLGADDLGLFRMTSTIYGIALLIAAVGIPAAMIKYVAEFKEDRIKVNQIVSSGVITSLLLGIGFSVLFYFSSVIFAEIFEMPELIGLMRVLSLVFPFVLVNGALLGMLNGFRKMKKHAAAAIIQSVFMVIVTVVLIYHGFGVYGAVIGIVLSSVGSCAFLIWVCRGYFDLTFEKYRQTTRKLIKFGAQIFGGNAINMINYKADVVLIGFFLTTTDVGHYAVAVGFSTFFWIIPSAIQTITYPATSEYWANNDHSALQKMIDKSMKYTACILLPIGLGVGFFAEGIVTMIFGQGFVYAVLPLQILIVGTVIFGVAAKTIGGCTSAIGRPDINLKVTFISALINIILNLLLIPHFGIIGAAVATTVALSVISIIFLTWCIKLFSLQIDLKWYRNVSISVFLSMFLFYVGQIFLDKSIIGILILFILVIIIYYIFLNKEDRKYITSLI